MNTDLVQELEANKRAFAEALEQQAATSAILGVISASPSDLQPVFNMIAESAVRLCDGEFSTVFLFDGKLLTLVGHHGMTPEQVEVWGRTFPRPPGQDMAIGRTILSRDVASIPDVGADTLFAPAYLNVAQMVKFRSLVAVPMLHKGFPVGGIVVARGKAGPFPANQIELLKTFADQAVIAIENARLFQELEARTADLTHSVEQLTALSEIGRAVSTTLDLDTVLSTIVSRAVRLSGGYSGIIYEFDDTTQTFQVRAAHRITPEHLALLQQAPIRLGEGAIGQAGATREPVEVNDLRTTGQPVAPQVREQLSREGLRALLALPLVREERLLGGLVILRREARAFLPDVVELLNTFAAQSVLAMHNARLFRKIQGTNRDLTEALAYQTATSEVLRLMASSPGELQPVFNMIAESAVRLCDGEFSTVFRFDGKLLTLVGHHGVTPEQVDVWGRTFPRAPGQDLAIGRAILSRDVASIPDVDADTLFAPEYLNVARTVKFRSLVAVPMLHMGHPLGGIVVARREVGPFPGKQVELLKTFADQAVIAIESVRLFRKVNRQLDVIREVFGKYVPESVAEAIVAGKGHLKPIQTTATVLYSDLEAFTSIAERMSPEQVVQMLNEYFPTVIEPIKRQGGVVNQFHGDAMLVTFNVPVEDSHHADQAVRAACEIQQVLKGRTFAGASLRTRIGINTGTVIAGNVGSGDRVNYTVYGDAVNLAARLEQLNKDYDTRVLVSGTTVSLLTDTYPLEAMGKVTVRGKHDPVELFKLAI